MEKDAYIRAVLEKYPEWKDGEFVVKLRARGLVALIGQAWDEGFEHVRPEKKKMDLPEGFESLFGRFGD